MGKFLTILRNKNEIDMGVLFPMSISLRDFIIFEGLLAFLRLD